MSELSWKFPLSADLGIKNPSRHIFYVRDGVEVDNYPNVIKKSGVRPVRYLNHLGMFVGEYEQSSMSVLRNVERNPDIEYIESDISVTITEPVLGSIKPLKTQSVPWGIDRVGAPKVWEYTRGKGVRIAVIDTGIHSDHPAIRKNYKKGVNILSPKNSPGDYNGHGTHVAGTAAGNGSEWGLVGVAPQSHLYVAKAFNRKGSANLSDLLSAINWCIENKMMVINMSFGMEKVSESLRLAIQTAHRNGMVMVAATGNQGYSSKIDYPSRYPETIGVTSISQNGALSSFSNLGKGTDIAAPGDRILSAWLNNSKREMSGTSMAVPHVTGVVALLLQLKPNLNPEQIRYILVHSAKKAPRSKYSFGVVNAQEALKLLDKV